MTRKILPTRRPSETIEAAWGQHTLIITVGYNPDTGMASEVFADLGRGGDLAAVCRDAAVCISIALQHGSSPDALAKTMTRVPAWKIGPDGDMIEGEDWASPVGAIVGALVDMAGG